MKEILYKAKREDNGEWVYGLPFSRIGGGLFHNMINAIRCDKSGNICSVIAETVCEYTGLTDKLGNNIFEGDIVKIKDTMSFLHIGEVIFHLNGFYIRYNPLKIKDFDSYSNFCKEKEVNMGMDGRVNVKYEYEIIGNIHDNPELLKENGL